jgi:N-acetylmuramoyl-L-alanine amidase
MQKPSGLAIPRYRSGALRSMAATLLLATAPWSGAVWAGANLRTAALETDSGATILVLGLSGAVQPHVFTLDDPRRVVIDLPNTQRGIALSLPTGAGLVTSVRGGARSASAYRLVLEVPAAPAAPPRVVSASTSSGYQLRIALGRTQATSAPSVATVANVPTPSRESAAGSTAPRAVRPAHGPGAAGRDIIVAIDAGHGGDDPGASGPAGTHEKDVTLAIARTLAARLNDRPGMHAVLTRDSDRLIDLRVRFERARKARADLFISIHADAVRDRSITGASVYTLSYHGASSEAARSLADRENAKLGSMPLAGVDPNLASVLVSATQSQIMGESVEAADQVLSALDEVGAIRKKVVQHAGFMVLKSTDLPSMLVETAYISNPGEEQNLRSSAYQERLARAIESGVVNYFQRHPPDGTNYASTRGRDGKDPDDSGV